MENANWIDVKDSLPEEGQDVVVIYQITRLTIAQYHGGLAFYDRLHPTFTGSWPMLDHVMLWAPIPPLPQPDHGHVFVRASKPKDGMQAIQYVQLGANKKHGFFELDFAPEQPPDGA